MYLKSLSVILILVLLSSYYCISQFDGYHPSGQRYSLSNDKNKEKLLVFWAPWCGSCVREINTLNQFQMQYPSITVVGVSIDKLKPRDIKKEIAYNNIHFPVINADRVKKWDIGEVKSIPTMVLVDINNNILKVHIGSLEIEELVKFTHVNRNNEMKSIHCTVKGRVQGVSYRAWAKKHAKNLGLRGWVKNTSDGSVEAVFIGEEKNITQMTSSLWKGPFLARVDDIVIKTIESEELDDFEIRK